MTSQEFNSNYPLAIQIHVHWGEMDALGHVNNSVYFRYAESARIEYFKALNIELPAFEKRAGPILAHVECQFLMPVEYPDTLLVSSSVQHIGSTSLKMLHDMYSETQQQIVARAQDVLVLFDFSLGQKIVITDELRASIKAFEES